MVHGIGNKSSANHKQPLFILGESQIWGWRIAQLYTSLFFENQENGRPMNGASESHEPTGGALRLIRSGSRATDPEELMRQFQAKRPEYEEFTERLKRLIKDLLYEAEIKCHLIEGRTKEIGNLNEKLCRPGKKYGYELDEIPDLSGLRVIAYYIDDIDRITSVIKDQFVVDPVQSADKRDLLEENEFGYLSVHFVVRLDSSRATQMEWKRFSGLRAEIQVRTVLQHAWAAISHTHDYKSKQDIPTELKRKLYRLCGLFELADEQFLTAL